MHKKLVIHKLQKIANILDDNNLHKQADQLTLVMKKIAQIDPDSIRDLGEINNNNNVPNALLFYAAAVTQGVRENPIYDVDHYSVTLDKINSIKSNQYVIQNFPNIINNIEATIQKLKDKSKYDPDSSSSQNSSSSVNPLTPGVSYERPANAPSGSGQVGNVKKDIKPLLKTLAKNKNALQIARPFVESLKPEFLPIIDSLINTDPKQVENIIDKLDNTKIEEYEKLLNDPLIKSFVKEQFKLDIDQVLGLAGTKI